jgi:phosphoglycerol transferase MdoB-like AlkP superfamily enzyme
VSRDTWNRAVLAHAAGLLVLLLVLRVETASRLGADRLGPIGWVLFLVPDLGFLLVFEALWLLLGPGRGRRAALTGAHLLVAAFTALAHSFFLVTGYRLEIQLTLYAAQHFAMLDEIFSLSMDWRAGARLVAAAACALLPLVVWRRRSVRLPRMAALGALLMGLALCLLPLRTPLAANDVSVFLASSRTLLRERLASRYALAPADFHRPPVVAGAPARLPSVILVVLESTGAGAVAPWTSDADTPNLERLAEGGILVENAYASVTHTSKALIGILCGVLPRLDMEIVETGEGNLPVSCLPAILGTLGYRTVYLQSAHSRFENRPGLVRNLGYEGGAYLETLARAPFEKLGYFGLDDRAMVEPALDWIARVGESPYFMTLLTSVPHHPYQTPGVSLKEALAIPQEAYRQAIAAQDRFLGELVAGLERAGALERAVLVVLGDHGEAFGEHLRRQHDAVPYEEVVRVPWVLYSPAVLGAPRAVGGLRHQIDLLPTVLGLLGVPWEGKLSGRDLLTEEGHELVASACWYANTCMAARIGDTKVIYHFGRWPLEIYDLASDPGERRNIARVLPRETVDEVEDRMLGYKVSVDRFWAQFPVREGPERWWAAGSARPR